MSSILGLCLLYGLLANLPTAVSIHCYACADHPGSTTPCDDNAPVVDCPNYFDSCMTMVITVEFYGRNYTSIAKNCSLLQYSCDQTSICDQVNSSIVSAGGDLTQCSLICCHGDLCNGPAGPHPTGGPVPTAEPEPPSPGPDTQSRLQYYIETMRALLDQIEYIVNNEVGGNQDFPEREFKDRVKRALADMHAVLKNEEQNKREVVFDQLKNDAAIVMKKLQSKQIGRKKRAAMNLREQKRRAKSRQLMSGAMKAIEETFAMMVSKKH